MGKRNANYYQEKAERERDDMRKERDEANRLLEKFRKTAEQAHSELMYGSLGHSELAGRLFMLDRRDLNHVSMVQAGRDRILWLANQVHDKDAEIQRLKDELLTYSGEGRPKYVAIPANAPLNVTVDAASGTVTTQLADNYKLLRNTTQAERSWPHTGENGQYQNLCVHCDRVFLGHKRTPSCRVCHDEREKDNITGMAVGATVQELHNVRMNQMLHGKISVEQAFDKCP